jgi:exodeoxyribonuclease V
MTNTIVLTEEQERAVDTICRLPSEVQTLGGFAGTGKTTVIRELVERLSGFAVCAYTGKAADVLRRKGIPASTIHSLIYLPTKGNNGTVIFELIPGQLFTARGVIVDEASMVSKRIYDDLLLFGVPLVFVGDHGQLEPVGDSGFNLMAKPDVTLETVHRNAGNIAQFAENMRKGEFNITGWANGDDDGEVDITTFDEIGKYDIDHSWQLICAYNRTRCSLNAMVRNHLGLPDGEPVVGDRVICLQNNRRLGLFNGMQGTISEIDRRKRLLTFDSNQGVSTRVNYNPRTFGSEAKPEWSGDVIPFDWAYCVTCHKAQGDEFDNVCVVEQHCSAWDHRRWAYTAASRAKRRLVWVAAK